MVEEREDLVDDDVVAAGAVANAVQYLKGMDFPASKDDILQRAERNAADESALEELRRIPDQRYDDAVELMRALGDEVKGLGRTD